MPESPSENTSIAAELVFIGTIRSKLTKLTSCPKQGVEGAPSARIDILPQYREALIGITPGTRLIIFTWLHQSNRHVLQVHPRDKLSTPLTGVFATRSEARPNPIGLHPVEVISTDESGLIVSPMETLDGTPVIDIKIELC